MTSRQEKALAAIEAAILELSRVEGLVKEHRDDEALTQIFKAHAYTGAARMYLDQEKAIELATQLELHAARANARRLPRGRVRP